LLLFSIRFMDLSKNEQVNPFPLKLKFLLALCSYISR
jgi:hypothetical protein